MKKLLLPILLAMLISSVANSQVLFPLADPTTGGIGLTDRDGKFIISGDYDHIYLFSDDLYVIVKGNMKGLIDANDVTGRVVNPLTLAYLGDPDPNGMVVYNINGKISDKTGAIKGGKWGFMNLKGESIGKEYSAVLPFYFHGENMAAVCEGGKVDDELPIYIESPSAINLSSEETFIWQAQSTTKNIYFDINFMTKAPMSSTFVSKGKWGFIDSSGKEIIPCMFDNIGNYFFEDKLVVEIGKKYGYIDKTGKIVIEPIYKNVGNFYDGKAAVATGNKWGYINYEGTEIVAPQYYTAMPFINDVALVGMPTVAQTYNSHKVINYGYVRIDGQEIVAPKYERGDIEFVNGLVRVYSNSDGWALLDTYGEKLTTEKYSMIGSRDNKYITVAKDGKTLYYDTYIPVFDIEDGDTITIPSYINMRKGDFGYTLFSEKEQDGYNWVDDSKITFPMQTKNKKIVKFDGCNIYVGGKYSLIDHKGKVVSKNIYSFIDESYGDRTIAITSEGKYCWLDSLGNELLMMKYKKIGRVFENLACVLSGSKYGVIDNNGKVVIAPKYDGMATRFYDGLLPVKTGGKWGCINTEGELVIPAVCSTISDINELVRKIYIPNGRVTPTQRELQLFLFTLQGDHNSYSIDDIIPNNMWSY